VDGNIVRGLSGRHAYYLMSTCKVFKLLAGMDACISKMMCVPANGLPEEPCAVLVWVLL